MRCYSEALDCSWTRSCLHGLAGLALVGASACHRGDPPADVAPDPDPCEGACIDGSHCDPASARCFCEVGTIGDPRTACVAHDDFCSDAEARVDHSVCEHAIETPDTFTVLSIGHGKNAALSRAVKFLVPAVPNARLPTVFADTNWYRSHHCLMARGFEPYFPGLSYPGYQELVFDRTTREYYGGTLSELSVPDPSGIQYVFTVETRDLEAELLSTDQIYGVYRQLQDRVGIGSIAYTTDAPIHLEQAMAWENPPFPVLILPEAAGPQYEVYTPGLAYGRVRRFTADELAQAGTAAFGWQDIVVLDRAPVAVEGVMAASITEARQDVLTHLNVLSAMRGTPNFAVADALEVLAPYEGELVRIEALESYYSIREASVDEAEAHWATQRPHAEPAAVPDFEHTELLDLDLIAVADPAERTQAISRFGSKVAGLAVLRSIADPAHVVEGFGIPMSAYARFMEDNTWQAPVAGGTTEASYAETIALWLADEEFRSDAMVRAARLSALRSEMLANGVVDPALLDEIRTRITAVTGSATTMMRLRSSSNAEDALAFNGAGLYESASACGPDEAADPESACEPGREPAPLAAALVRVWASLWSFGAYEEREYYQLDHAQVGMGVLCNPRFEDELANGVAFTGNPTDPEDPRLTINVQVGEVDVVAGTPGVLAELDRVLVEDGEVVSIEREVASSLVPAGQVVLDDERLRELALVLDAVEASYPIDATPPEGTVVMLDLEFKLTPAGVLMLKQIRPFAVRPYAVGEGSCH